MPRLIWSPVRIPRRGIGWLQTLPAAGYYVNVADKLSVNVSLEVGSVSDTVTIAADAEQLRTEDAQTGEVITNKFIENLPQLNRDPLQLLRISGNVQG